MKQKAVVIGGGPAGLALACDLARGGLRVSLYEASNQLGGLAGSFSFGPIEIDRYYHFICGGDTEYFKRVEELSLQSKLKWNRTTTGYFLKRKTYSFSNPLAMLCCQAMSWIGRLRYLAFAAQCSFRSDWKKLDEIQAVQWLRNWVGEETYNLTWRPLLEIKMRSFTDKISAAWVWHRVHRVAKSRKALGWYESMGYLQGGTQVLIDALGEEARRLGVEIHMEEPVQRLLQEGTRCVGVELTNARKVQGDVVVSTVPLPVFCKIASDLPKSYMDELRAIEFLAVRCVVLRLKKPISSYFWLNIHDPAIPYNGIIEYSNLNPTYTPDGSSIAYVPFYLERSDPLWTESDAELIQRVTQTLPLINPEFSEDWIIDVTIGRDPHAQPVCTMGFGDRIPKHKTVLDNLFLIESTQLYPEDRSVSATMSLARRVGEMVLNKKPLPQPTTESVPSKGYVYAEC